MTEERIVAAARQIMETSGLDSVTMRRVATELGVTAMALYHHVADKHALVAMVADQVMDVIPDESLGGVSWYEALRHGFLAVHREIARYPGLGLYISSTNSFYPSGYRKLKKTIQMLVDAGFDEHEAIEINYVLLAYQGGYFLTEQSAQRSSAMPITDEQAEGPPEIRSRAVMNSYDSFIRGLDIVIAGFRAKLAAKQVLLG
ncbi:transcriptional regulator, tetr family [Sphingobium fuliginis]|uniref:Transcriptional regulator, tetr family n=1 Tax=Sphingobium fuliginis (strain ATCC 27551) TaxID=336203 RepID=A0A292ZAJ8_SPHSA|nr:transcriptional regulator, tetr family [Sphingobium fuliginis]